MIKKFIVGHRPFTVFTVTASFPFAVYLFVYIQRITKQKHKVSHFYLFFQNLGRNLYIFIHSLINSKSNELPQSRPPVKQMNG